MLYLTFHTSSYLFFGFSLSPFLLSPPFFCHFMTKGKKHDGEKTKKGKNLLQCLVTKEKSVCLKTKFPSKFSKFTPTFSASVTAHRQNITKLDPTLCYDQA